MVDTKVCLFAGETGDKEYSMLEKYAKEGCIIAFMSANKNLAAIVKEELERKYHVAVFFFHGSTESEEDREIFFSAVKEKYGRIDYIICKND